jgi:WD40 repeat protein
MGDPITLWTLTRGDEVARIERAGEIRRVAVSGDGRLLATVSAQGSVRVWSTKSDFKSLTVELKAVALNRLIFSQNGTHLAAAGSSRIFLIDLARPSEFVRLAGYPEVDQIAVSANHVAIWNRQRRSIRLLQTGGGRELASVSAANVSSLQFSADGASLAARHDERFRSEVRLWSIPDLRDKAVIGVQPSRDFALGPKGDRVAVEFRELDAGKRQTMQFIDIWDVASRRRVARLRDEARPLRFDGQSRLLLTLQDNELRVWNIATATIAAHLKHERDITAVRFSSEDGILATLSSGRAYIWDYVRGELLSQIEDDGRFEDAQFTPNGRYLLTGSTEGAAVLWLWKTEDLQAEACKRLPCPTR